MLIEYIKRQPEISFPTKICSRSVEDMNKKHLIRALAGNYGYIRGPVVSSAVTEASPCLSDNAAEVPIDLLSLGGSIMASYLQFLE